MRLLAAGGALSLIMLLALGSPTREALAACSGPTGYAGDQIYNSTSKVMQYCNGAKWIPMWGNSLGLPGSGGSGGGSCEWEEVTSLGTRVWRGIASSTDGSKIVAAANGSDFAVSTNRGQSWAPPDSGGSASQWYPLASSADGVRVIAGNSAVAGRLYRSIDSGKNWTMISGGGAPSGRFNAITMSPNGQIIYATNSGAGSGTIYRSTDGGDNWTALSNPGSGFWKSLAMSANGQRVIAAGTNYIYISTDSGNTWTTRPTAGNKSWAVVASSANGMRLIAGASGEKLFTSTDGGDTWSEQTNSPVQTWNILSSSDDGMTLIAGGGGSGQKYFTSVNGGVAWNEETILGTGQWFSGTVSGDGNVMFAGRPGGGLYIKDCGTSESGGTSDCTTGAIGSACSDGSIYIGKIGANRILMRNQETASVTLKTVNTSTPGTTGTTDGKVNTDAMIAAGAGSHPAASNCRTVGAEWNIPSEDELNLLWINSTTQGGLLDLSALGINTTGTYYWSSTENAINQVIQRFSDGAKGNSNRTGTSRILRCMKQIPDTSGGESNALMERGKISTGSQTSCAIGTDGKAYCWGYNARGTVGDNTTTNRATAVEVSSEDVSNSYKLIETDYQTCAIHTNNSTYCWGGLNNYGELGNNAEGVTSHKPVLVQNGGSPGTFTSLSVSAYTACGLATDNKVYCWGLTWGMGSPGGSSAVPRVVSNGANAAGTYKYLGSTSTASHCAIGTDNKAYCWGYNSSGQLGNNTTTQTAGGPPTLVLNGASPGTFKKIATGQGHTCAIGTDDKAYCWGSDSSGQLGTTGPAADSLIPVLVNNGEGPGTYKEITAGEAQTCAIGTDNKVYCWGMGSQGSLGNGTNVDSPTPVAVLNGESSGGFRTIESSSSSTVCGIASDNKAYCWGGGGNYSIGDGNNISRNVPTKVANGASSGFFGDGAGTGSVDITAEERCDNAEGDFVGNACWFLGGNGRSCKKVCEDNFGLYDDTTLTYAGSGGNAANCQAVMTALGAAGTTAANASNAHGCYLSGSLRYRGTLATTELSATAGVQRACACKVGGDDLGNHTATKDINMNNNRIINVGAPSAGTDIATKAYIDARTGTNETDPKIGAVTASKWCATNSGVINCDKDPDSGPTGYFVLGRRLYTGNLGGLSGANQKCLDDLQDFDWKGKSEATLNSSTVKAWLCDSTTCQDLAPNTKYTFAAADEPTQGGKSFTTDAAGLGPNDSNAWGGDTEALTQHSGRFFTNRATGTSTKWGAGPNTAHCSNWTNATGPEKGGTGIATNYNNSARWEQPVGGIICSTGHYLLCAVAPPSGPATSIGGTETPLTVIAAREKTQGSSAGLATGMTPGTWYDYPLNRLRQNSLEIIMTDGGIRLPAGKYYVDAVVPFARNGSAKARLYNSSAGAVLATGTPSYNGSGVVPPMMGHITYSYVRGIFTLSSTATIKLQTVLISGTPSTDPTPFGMPNAAGPETYGILKIEKIN